jgi:hypothetical protein
VAILGGVKVNHFNAFRDSSMVQNSSVFVAFISSSITLRTQNSARAESLEVPCRAERMPLLKPSLLDRISPTGVIAVYGAILSTITLVIQLSDYFRDKAKVRVTIRKNMKTINDPRYRGMTLTIVTATNVGRHPVTIQGFAKRYLFRKGQKATDAWLNDAPKIPEEITEGREVHAYVDQAGIDFGAISHWYCWDSAGGKHRVNEAPWYKRWISELRYRLHR